MGDPAMTAAWFMPNFRGRAARSLAGLLAATAAFAAPIAVADDRTTSLPSTPLAALIADPEAYHGKAVSVVAYVTIEFENMTACASEDETAITACLWLNIDDGPFRTDADYARYQSKLRDWQRFNRRTVIFRATFDKTERGHFSMWPGGFGSVRDVSLR